MHFIAKQNGCCGVYEKKCKPTIALGSFAINSNIDNYYNRTQLESLFYDKDIRFFIIYGFLKSMIIANNKLLQWKKLPWNLAPISICKLITEANIVANILNISHPNNYSSLTADTMKAVGLSSKANGIDIKYNTSH